jgi:DNA-binding NtrC family response regulator/tetratricopeptide (TPR) repeat protein
MAEQDLISRASELDRTLPFVGRERELTELRALYDRAALDGAGRLVLVVGSQGIGKSRLVGELLRRLRAQGVPAFEGTCAGGGVAYQPFVEIAHTALSYLSDAGVSGERLARAAEVVAALRGRRGRERPRGGLAIVPSYGGGGDQRISFFEQVRQLLVDVAATRPPLLVIHDAHLADGASAQLLAYLARTLAPALGLEADGFAGLIVVTTEETAPSWIDDVDATRVELGGLDLEGLRAFLSSEPVLRRLLEASGGVPRRLEALLDQEPRRPADVAASRLAALSPRAARLVRALALYGRPAGAALLERLAAALGGDDPGEPELLELGDCPLLARSVVGGELRLGFAQAADRAAIVRALADGERTLLHRALGEALLVGLEAGDDPAACAEHLLEGQAGERSVDVALVAGEALERSFAYERATALYARALAASTRPEVVAVLEERLADLYERTSDYRRALEVVARLAERRPDPATLGRAGHLQLLAGDFPAARRALQAARAAAESAGDVVVHVQVLADLAESHFLDGAHDEALAAGAEALARSAESADVPAARRGRIAARNSLGKVWLEKGDYESAAGYFHDNLDDAGAAGALFEVSRAHINLGICALRRADFAGAEAHYRAGLSASREHGDLRHRAFCLQNLGVLAQWRRDYGAALRFYQEAAGAFKRLGQRPWLAWVALDLGDLYLGLGDVERAQAMVALADRLATDVATTNVILENLRGRIHQERGDLVQARACIEAALAAARRIGNKDELSLTLLYLARLDLAAGEPAAALDRLAEVPQPCPARVLAQLLGTRGEARLAAGAVDPARADLVAAERAYAELGDDEGRLRALLATATLCDLSGDGRGARQIRQLARELDDRLRARVPAELGARYGRDPQRLALREPSERPAPRLAVVPRPAPVRPMRSDPFVKIVGGSVEVAHVLEMVERVAPHDSLVLIRGESGTGKELVAEAIHEHSPRKSRPFVKVNCGALVESLLLSELFGHERGAFTGALARRKGRFELADGGTLFLDEIGDISPQTQVALLRVLQTHEFERVGGTQPIRVDVRIICATNRDLEAMVQGGSFREDLYYRLKGIEIDLPPLRKRAEDIPELVRHFLGRIADERQTTAKAVTPAALDALTRYPWPGNIRELENVIRSVTLFADGADIDVGDLTEYIGARPVPSPQPAPAPAARTAEIRGGEVYAWAVANNLPLRELKRRIELECITKALNESGGNITRAAERLGMKRPRLSQLLKEHGLTGRVGTEEKR